MDDWVRRALAKWPDVPALYGWLALDRRGRWRLRGDLITHPRIVAVIDRNYAADDYGRWYFQNGPQRGYVALAYAPLVLQRTGDDGLAAHTGVVIEHAARAYLDEEGSLVLDTPAGPGLVDDHDLAWVLERLRVGGRAVDDADLATALALDDGADTALTLAAPGGAVTVTRCDAASLPRRLGFVRDPQPRPGEKSQT